MKLDRNANPDGRGKYALVKLRQLTHAPKEARQAVDMLHGLGLIHYGDEAEGEQFFVMKYKDKFTGPALSAYASAVLVESVKPVVFDPELAEYYHEICRESERAKFYGKRIPD
jgi:hypothetical protein